MVVPWELKPCGIESAFRGKPGIHDDDSVRGFKTEAGVSQVAQLHRSGAIFGCEAALVLKNQLKDTKCGKADGEFRGTMLRTCEWKFTKCSDGLRQREVGEKDEFQRLVTER